MVFEGREVEVDVLVMYVNDKKDHCLEVLDAGLLIGKHGTRMI